MIQAFVHSMTVCCQPYHILLQGLFSELPGISSVSLAIQKGKLPRWQIGKGANQNQPMSALQCLQESLKVHFLQLTTSVNEFVKF